MKSLPDSVVPSKVMMISAFTCEQAKHTPLNRGRRSAIDVDGGLYPLKQAVQQGNRGAEGGEEGRTQHSTAQHSPAQYGSTIWKHSNHLQH